MKLIKPIIRVRITTQHLLTFLFIYFVYSFVNKYIFSKTYFICNSTEKKRKTMSNSEKIIHLDTISSSTYLIPYVFLYAFFHLSANIDEIIGWLSVFFS